MLLDFLRFDRYLTPAIIRIFYFLQLALIGLFALSGLISAIGTLFSSFFAGVAMLCATIIVTALGLIAARIATEIVMVLFQNNEHLAAIRARADGH